MSDDDELEAWSGGDEAQEVGSVKKKKNQRYVTLQYILSPFSSLSSTFPRTRRDEQELQRAKDGGGGDEAELVS